MEGIQRLKKMVEGQKSVVLQQIVKYLISREDMNEKYLNKEKDLKGMADYINGEVLKSFCEKMNTKNPSQLAEKINLEGVNAKCLVIDFTKEDTFKLAINYFNKSNNELGIKKKEVQPINATNQKNIKNDEEFGSIFDFNTKTESTERKKEEIDQISLFGM